MSKKIIHLLICVLLIFSCFFPAGCWDRRELNELAIVLAAGIDTDDTGVELTVQLARPHAFAGGAERQGGQAQQNNVWVVSSKGRTVHEAQRMLERRVSRDIYWGHNIILVFGEQIAKQGLRTVTNFFSRLPGARETAWIFVTPGKAKELLNSHSQLENTSAQVAGNMARMAIGVPVMLKDLKMMTTSKGINPVLPRLELTASGTPQGVGEFENIPAAGEEQQATKIHAEITTTGTGIFNEDKLVCWLDIEETRGLAWLKDEMKKGSITIPSLEEPDKEISIEITRGSTDVKPFYDGQNIWFDVTIKMEGDLMEQQCFEDITNPQIFNEIEKNLAWTIETRARDCLDKVQYEFGVDSLGFGEAFHRKYKKEWAQIKDNWDEIFSTADININVDAKIRRTGLETKRATRN